jgi:vitamin K-dependent gamma-carboxylase
MSRIQSKLFTPVDISWLVFFRIIFGGVMLIEVYRYFANGWIDAKYSPSAFHFTFYGFDWVKPWPGSGMRYHFAILGLSAACITVGFCYRLMALTFFLGFTYVFLLEATSYLNHFYLVCLISFAMIFLPAARAWSVDCWLRPALRSRRGPCGSRGR